MNFNPISGQQPQPKEISESTEIAPSSSTQARTVSNKESEKHHYSALAQMLAEVSQDHAHLRSFVYEFARIKLRKELYPRFVEGAWSEIEEQMLGLENAIDLLEAGIAKDAPSLPFKSPSGLPDGTKNKVPHIAAIAHRWSRGTTRFGVGGIHAQSLLTHSNTFDSSLPIAAASNVLESTALGKHLRLRSWLRVQLLAAVILGVAIYAAFDARTFLNRAGLNWWEGPTRSAAKSEAVKEKSVTAGDRQEQLTSKETQRQRVGDIPIPTEYGAYAVVNGRLIELEQLAIRVPDPRVAISAAISVPSRAHLSSSPGQFVVFRKDLLNGAPDRAAVRIVAKVVRELSFDTNGRAKKSSVEQSWVVRNNAYPMRVGPLPDNPEMIVIRSESGDFVLPAGRYVLVLKGVGYDFTIDGPVTDPVHCLERTDALNAPIYSECPKS
ncbi:MAG: hypothetical protein WB384_22745 [Candidatus Sulfotelmatobacter sp.]